MSSHTLRADVAGSVWKIEVAVGDAVRADQDLLILESMKMEIPACAPIDGVISEILVAVGDPIGEGQALLRLTAR